VSNPPRGERSPARPAARLRDGVLFAALLAAATAALVAVLASRIPTGPEGAGVAPAAASTERPSAPSTSTRLAPSLVTVARGVHLLGRMGPNAAYLVETSAGLALVDTCPQEDAEPVLRQIEELGLDVSGLRVVLLTHGHGDHALGANRLRALSAPPPSGERARRPPSGAKVHAGRGDCGVLAEGTSRDAFFSVFTMPQEARPVDVDVPLDGGETIELGDARFVVLAMPGHTPGSVCYLLERDGRRILFTGDVVMSLTDTSPLGGPGIYAAYLPPRYRGDARAFVESLRRLRAMTPPDLVLPGHPAADRSPQSPEIAPGAWDALLGRAIAKLDVLVARHAADGADFLDGVPKELLPGLSYWGDLDGRAVYGFVAASGRAFVVNAPGGPRLADLVRARLAATGAARDPTAVLLTSCAPEDLTGLRALVTATGCTVVAPREGFDAVSAACPPGTALLDAASLPAARWFPVTVVPVEGLAAAGAAYALPWQGRTVVLTGALPVRTKLDWGLGVFPALPAGPVQLGPCRASLAELARLAPDLWLPAAPVCGQNANLYDGEWARIVEANAAMLR
jgi:glyoxylase-like metal-dependent hydrolase (beta-lactamase superfamily II)